MRILRETQKEELGQRQKEEKERMLAEQKSLAHQKLVHLAQKEAIEDRDETLQQNKMNQAVKEMQQAAAATKMDTVTTTITRVLATYQSKFLLAFLLFRNYVKDIYLHLYSSA